MAVTVSGRVFSAPVENQGNVKNKNIIICLILLSVIKKNFK